MASLKSIRKGFVTAIAVAVATSALQAVSVPTAHADEPTPPSAPTGVLARPGVNAAKVYFAAPLSDGGDPVTGYTVTSVPEGKTCTATAAATSCRVTGLTNGQSYRFDVVAQNLIGESPAASTNSVSPRTDGAAPVLVSSEVTPDRVSSVGGTNLTVLLHITDDVSGRANPSGPLDANPAILFRRGSAGGATFGFTRAVTRISGDEYDGMYRAVVTVPAGTAPGQWDLSVYPIRDSAGNSTSFITKPGVLIGAPQPPTSVSAAADPATPERDVTVTWTPPADTGGNAITSYQVTDSYTGESHQTTDTSWTGTFEDISASTDLTFTVTAVNAAGSSVASSPSAAVRLAAAPPTPPRNVTAIPGNGRVDVAWEPPSSDRGADVSGYRVVATPGGHEVTAPAGTTSASVTGLSNGTSYTFSVSAINSAGTSAASDESSPVIPATVPDQVSGVVAKAGDGSAELSWDAPEDNGAPISGYRINVSDGRVIRVAGTTTSASVSGLINGRAYELTVAAVNSVGEGSASTAVQVTPAGSPGVPAKPVAKVKGQTITFTWKAAASNGSPITHYVITGGKPATKSVKGDVYKLIMRKVPPGKYKLRVAARSALGTGKATKAVLVKIPK